MDIFILYLYYIYILIICLVKNLKIYIWFIEFWIFIIKYYLLFNIK